MDKKRKIVQWLGTILCNMNVKGFLNGKLYTGKWKGVCVPGLNCYSCPAATGSCPLGMLQSVFGNLRRTINYYVVGLLLLFGTLFGRVICGWLCPFGLLQELLYKIPSPKCRKKWKHLLKIKYLILAVFVVLIPVGVMLQRGIGIPGFCKYICPQGTIAGTILVITNPALQAMVGMGFLWKLLVLLIVLSVSIFIFRPFCKILCPLGAIYGLFNSFSFVHIEKEGAQCTTCGACERACPMQIEVMKKCNDVECIRCGKCIKSCDRKALKMKLGWRVPDDYICGVKQQRKSGNK